MDERFCVQCGALLGRDEHEVCSFCGGYACGSAGKQIDEILISQRYEIRPEKEWRMVDYDTIRAAVVACEKWASDRVTVNYAQELDDVAIGKHQGISNR